LTEPSLPTEKSQKKTDFFWLFLFPIKVKGIQKTPEFQNLASNTQNWQPWSTVA